jgi:ParB/RepB/Spo0J family partition protein
MEGAIEEAREAPVTAIPIYRVLALKELVDSPFQADRISSRGDLGELAASMGNGIGIIEPLIVRPAFSKKSGAHYEIVAGHRRKRAAVLAGLLSVPCIVRELTDVEVLDLQTIENGQREGLHPLDEADHFALSIKHGRSVAEIADNNGRDRSYVAKRLQLLKLTKAARKAFEEDKLTLGAAIVVARVPESLQDEALKALIADRHSFMGDQGAPCSERKARDLIVDKFMLQLGKAAWKLDDAELVPSAGPCTTCVKRTGNQAELFDDVKSKDLCTDPRCHRTKSEAVFEIRRKEAITNGQRVLEGRAAKEALRSYGTEFVRVDGDHYDYKSNKQVKVAALVKKHDVALTLAQDPETGAAVDLVKREAIERVLAKSQAKDTSSKPTKGESPDAKHRREQRKAKRLIELVLPEAVAAAEKKTTSKPSALVTALLRYVLEVAGWDNLTKLMVRRGTDAEAAKRKAPEMVLTLFDKGGADAQIGIVAEAILLNRAPRAHYKAEWGELLKVLGVNLAKHEKVVEAEERERAAIKRAGKKAKPAGAVAAKAANVGKGKLAAKVKAKKKAAVS